ncbi:MAG: Gfo/Idh/MocA family oxidoreductase, partial [Chloroflexi bacterium]|nr:Gfo/Idh/MocA family oxidoreductase [Chloroflexota bacterium]
KQIFCEKPLALTLKECDEALAAVEKAKVKLQIGFMRRYDPACVAAKQQIDSGAIGTPVMFKSMGRDPKRTSLEFAKRENGGGLILDMGVHDYDLARWLMGSEVERVYSEGGCLVYPELKEVGDIDNAVVNLKFANGAVGNVDLSRNAVYGYDVRTEVIGSKGSLFIGNAYPAEIRDFVRCVMEDRQPQVTGRDGRAAVAIGVAATKSLDEGKPITL